MTKRKNILSNLLPPLGAALRIGVFLLAGCVSHEEFDALKQSVAQLQQVTTQQQAELMHLTAEDRRLWRGLRCPNAQVADFMAAAENCPPGQCPQKSLDRVVDFMITQPHVLVRLKPGQTIGNIAPLRISQLQDTLKVAELTPLSRILILTMGVKLMRDAVALPEGLSLQLIRYLRRDLQLATSIGYVGPYLVDCEQKSRLLDNYARHVLSDKPVSGEPKSNEPQVAIWIFKVDCG